eukprot:Colp12_sorted_trinity150504_noHs@19624
MDKQTLLNSPLLFTWLVDYIVLYGYIAVCFHLMSDGDFTAIGGALSMGLLLPLLISLEYFYSIVLRKSFAKIKLEYKPPLDNYLAMAKLITQFMSMVAATSYLGIFHFDWNGWLYTPLLISFEYWFISIAKDEIMMRYVHKWMHKPENYWMHKVHHRGNMDTNFLTVFYFDLPDLIIENMGGPLFLLAFKYALGIPLQVHLASFLFLAMTDGNYHSLNPFHACYLNPVMDWFTKPTVVHNLHHAVQNDYFTLIPWAHFKSANRRKDLDKYNKMFKTAISFDLFC